jgi:hypothetical protein
MTSSSSSLPLPKGRGDRRKLLVYGGVAVALLVVILLRRQAASSTQAPSDSTDALTPVSNPAAGDMGPYTGVDNGSQLAGFENALMDQLPQVIESGIQAGFANYIVAPAPAAAADPTTPSPQVAFDPANYLSAAANLISLGVGLAGASNAGTAGPASNNVKPAVHPVAASNVAPAPRTLTAAPNAPHVTVKRGTNRAGQRTITYTAQVKGP